MARAAGSSWLLLGILGALAVAQACTRGGDDSGALDVLLAEALAAVGPEVVRPSLADFDSSLDELDSALASWQAGGAREDARPAWTAAMLVWEELEVQQVGPAGSSVTVVGGEDLRDEIYSWPTVNGCRVDQETVEEEWDAGDFYEANLVNSYGMDALEHLLYAGEETVCPSQVGIDEDWAALGSEGVDENRAAFAVALAGGVRQQAAALDGRWAAGYEPAALDEVFAALFYLELVSKDEKLAKPLGLSDFGEATCAEDVELLASGIGVDAIEANLDGFRELFSGGEGAGMDDLLAEIGHGDLSDEVLANTDAAIAVAAGLEGPLDELIESQPEQVEALHAALKGVTDILKGDLVTVLVLTVPGEASGDND